MISERRASELPTFDVRYSHMGDGTYLHQWLKEPGMLHWFPMATDKELENAVQVWVGFFRISSSLTATVDGKPCGIATLFLMPYRKVAHHCLFKIIVAPDYQRQGVGGALLRNLMHLAKNYFHLELIHIEIFEGNPIEHLLKKQGFRIFARQEKFVKEKEEYLGRILLEADL